MIVAAEDVTSHKPGPEPVRYGLKLLGVEAGAAAMIGDSPHDIQAARAAGVTSVAAGWSRVPRDQILAAGPEVLVASMTEFVDFCLDGPKGEAGSEWVNWLFPGAACGPGRTATSGSGYSGQGRRRGPWYGGRFSLPLDA